MHIRGLSVKDFKRLLWNQNELNSWIKFINNRNEWIKKKDATLEKIKMYEKYYLCLMIQSNYFKN